MAKSKNIYIYPIKIHEYVGISYNTSPAHVGRLKYAVDFFVPEGTPIVAAAEGVVDEIKQDSDKAGPKSFDRYGNYIELNHKNDECSIYEHIKKNGSVVKVGQKVKAGQLIGYAGDTGWSYHVPHLHFDVHKYFGKGGDDYNTVKIRWKKKSV